MPLLGALFLKVMPVLGALFLKVMPVLGALFLKVMPVLGALFLKVMPVLGALFLKVMPVLGALFLKVIGIGENVIGIFSYFSITFSITSYSFLTQIIYALQMINKIFTMLYLAIS